MTKVANTMRGETEFQINGQAVLLRPTFENLVAAEEEIGSLFGLVERASEGQLTLAEIATLLWHCIPSEPRPSRDEVGNAVLEMGFVASAAPVRVILSQVLQGKT